MRPAIPVPCPESSFQAAGSWFGAPPTQETLRLASTSTASASAIAFATTTGCFTVATSDPPAPPVSSANTPAVASAVSMSSSKVWSATASSGAGEVLVSRAAAEMLVPSHH